MRPYQLILFDLDGTIADTELVMVQTMIDFFQRYTPDRKTSLHEILSISGPPLLDSLKHFFPKEDATKLVKEFAVKAREFYPKFAVAFAGVDTMLASLKEQHIQFGIVTSKLRINALFTLEVIGLKDAFPLVITLDEVKQPKPNPEGILLALQHFHIPPSQTLFVGDTIYDYQAGVAAGVDTALVKWSTKHFDATIQPTYWLASFDQLKEFKA
jgi:pyrophosphatase PpaX